MPIVKSTYNPPLWMRNGHVATIAPSFFRQVSGVIYTRRRIITPDDDFLDLDWILNSSNNLVIISHGLEGSSNRPYVLGMAKFFDQKGWDVLAWNCRSCSGEINRTSRFYHHGATDDLMTVIDHANEQTDYQQVWLAGFSMGGSLTIKYLGENGADVPKNVKGGITFSIPVSLRSSVDKLSDATIKFYEKRFLKKLEDKVRRKAEKYPDLIDYNGFDHIHSFRDFDNAYTAPLHGFTDAEDFYTRSAAGKYMLGTTRPILICNALNDPFLGVDCYPYESCRHHDLLYLEAPKYGGHVGFTIKGGEYSYMEQRAWEFVDGQ